MCDRYRISDQVGAAIANSAFQDVEVIDKSNKSFVIDEGKLRKEREKHRNEIKEDESKYFELVYAIYILHGRKDSTPTLTEKENEKSTFQLNLKSPMTVGEQSKFYFSHFSSENGKGHTIAKQIHSIIANVDLKHN